MVFSESYQKVNKVCLELCLAHGAPSMSYCDLLSNNPDEPYGSGWSNQKGNETRIRFFFSVKTTIIQAGVAHIDVIRDISERTWWPAYRSILSAEQIRYMLDTLYARENISHQLESGSQTYLLLMEEDRALGFAAYGAREEKPEVYKLHKLYCLPENQGRGYGRMLVEAVSKRVAELGIQILELNVNRYNQARGFYEKLGFRVAYEEDIPIGNYWMNDYVMRKEMPGF